MTMAVTASQLASSDGSSESAKPWSVLKKTLSSLIPISVLVNVNNQTPGSDLFLLGLYFPATI